jgi:hypothetical protein
MISISNLPVDKTNFSDLPALSDAARFCLQKAQGSQSLKKDNFSKCDFHAKTHVQSEALKLCGFLGVFSAMFDVCLQMKVPGPSNDTYFLFLATCYTHLLHATYAHIVDNKARGVQVQYTASVYRKRKHRICRICL